MMTDDQIFICDPAPRRILCISVDHVLSSAEREGLHRQWEAYVKNRHSMPVLVLEKGFSLRYVEPDGEMSVNDQYWMG